MKFFLAVIMLAISIPAYATNVRGRIDFRSYNGYFPMAKAVVKLCPTNGGNCLSSTTGTDGMYYFNTRPGQYRIYLNGRIIFTVNIPNQQYFDMNPLLGN